MNEKNTISNKPYSHKDIEPKWLILITEYKKANSILTEYLLLSPSNKDAYYYLGVTYMNLNKYNFAKDAFNKVILLDELYPNAHYYLGLIFESILNHEKAIFHYKQAKRNGCLFKDLNLVKLNILFVFVLLA